MTEFKKWRAPKAAGRTERSRSEDNVAAVRNSDDDTRKILRDCQEYLLRASFKTLGSVSVVSEPKGARPGRGAGTDLDLVI